MTAKKKAPVRLSIITATCGRETLARTLASLAPQLGDGDELLVCRRDGVFKGNATRDDAIKRAAGTHLWWMDDDDVATDDALETIRQAVAEDPGTVHVFRMEMVAEGRTLWNGTPTIQRGHIGGPQFVVPNRRSKLGTWVHDGECPPGSCGDHHFLTGTLEKLGRQPVFHDHIIARIRP